jgi:hypothetical protein
MPLVVLLVLLLLLLLVGRLLVPLLLLVGPSGPVWMSRASSSTSSYVGGASPSISVAKCWTFEFKVPSSADWVPSPAVVERQQRWYL